MILRERLLKKIIGHLVPDLELRLSATLVSFSALLLPKMIDVMVSSSDAVAVAGGAGKFPGGRPSL